MRHTPSALTPLESRVVSVMFLTCVPPSLGGHKSNFSWALPRRDRGVTGQAPSGVLLTAVAAISVSGWLSLDDRPLNFDLSGVRVDFHAQGSPVCEAMRAMEDDLRQLAVKANVDDSMLEYLQARRTVTVGLLANIAKDYTELDTILFTPLEAGFEANGKTHKVEAADIPIAKASLRYLWKLCCDHISAPHPQPTPPAGTPTPGTSTPNVPSGSGAKAQKELSADTMRDLLKYYEDEKVHGVRRVFPQKMLLGAEKIIARVHGEIQQKAYTPMALNEILCARYYDAAGNINPLAQAEHKNTNRVVWICHPRAFMYRRNNNGHPRGCSASLTPSTPLDGVGY